MGMYIGLGLKSREVDGFIRRPGPTLEPCALKYSGKLQVDPGLLPVTLIDFWQLVMLQISRRVIPKE